MQSGRIEIYLYSIFNFVVKWGGWLEPLPGRFIPGNGAVPIVNEAGWAPGPVWMDSENLAPHRDSITGPSSQ